MKGRIDTMERDLEERSRGIVISDDSVQIEEPKNEDKAVNQDDDSQNIPSASADRDISPPEQYDFVLLCDSNRKFIDTKKLCPKSSVKVISCGTTDKATEVVTSPRFLVRKGLIINTGVNDMEHLAVEDVVTKQVEMVNAARNAFPERKIIISSITPRDDDLDKAVLSVNDEVHRQIRKLPNVIHIDNSNLRNRELFFDRKHFNKRFGIPAFAANLKQGIRLACGIRLSDRRQQAPRPHADVRSTPLPARRMLPRTEEHNQSSQRAPDRPINSQGNELSAITSQISNLAGLVNRLLQVNSSHGQPHQRIMFPHQVLPPGFAYPAVFPPPEVNQVSALA